jgi:Xaa-Pro aminopeptidase
VHDAGDYESPLVAGSVITVEPGIYLSEENIGIRIEDNILITDSGYTNLSSNIPKDL